MTACPIAVMVPCLDARTLVGPSLAALKRQTLAPAWITVVDRGSTDGLGDWLRCHEPGLELRRLERAASPAALLEAAGPASRLAFLEPGDLWPDDHLERLAAPWSAVPEAAIVEAPAVELLRLDHGALRVGACRTGGALSAVGVRTAVLKGGSSAADDLLTAIHERIGPDALRVAAQGPPVRLVRSRRPVVAAEPLAQLARAVSALPAAPTVLVMGLHAAGRPAGLLDLLGLAVAVAADGRAPLAMTPAELSWTEIAAAPAEAPLLVSTPTALDLEHAADQLGMEDVLRRCADRPVRLLVRALVPSSPRLASRLVDAVQAHGRAELWVSDAVSASYAGLLLGTRAVRLVPPPLLALLAPLRAIAEHRLVTPMLLADGDGPAPAARFTCHEAWQASGRLDAARRLVLPLTRLLGCVDSAKGDVLHEAWARMLVGWSAFRQQSGPLTTCDLDLALFAGVAGSDVTLAAQDAKTNDCVDTWPAALTLAGIKRRTRSKEKDL